jgi:hypothetical protein
MQNTRAGYQQGSIRREKRRRGPDVWTLRWRETNADGSTTRRKTPIGTVEEYRTKAAAWKACEFLLPASYKVGPVDVADLMSTARTVMADVIADGNHGFGTQLRCSPGHDSTHFAWPRVHRAGPCLARARQQLGGDDTDLQMSRQEPCPTVHGRTLQGWSAPQYPGRRRRCSGGGTA